MTILLIFTVFLIAGYSVINSVFLTILTVMLLVSVIFAVGMINALYQLYKISSEEEVKQAKFRIIDGG